MDRVILHSDANAFYASVELLYRPELRGKPVAVGGDEEARHGIILAKSQEAKKFGIITGETIREAKDKCPWLITLPPDYPLYLDFSRKLRAMYGDYSDRVEPFGLDEAWVDVSNPGIDIERGRQLADEIRRRARDEIGVTLSVGVSFNKIFAKLGSDLKKPDATSVISRENYQEITSRLPVSDLLFVGPATSKKLFAMGILSISDLAQADPMLIKLKLGKNGEMVQAFARGLDASPVKPATEADELKSVGHSTTPPHDIRDMEDAKRILWLLSEAVAERLRRHEFRAKCVSIGARGTDLSGSGCQMTLPYPTALTSEIARAAVELFRQRYASGFPFRSVGVSCSKLVSVHSPEQLDIFGDHARREATERLERVVDGLRKRFGQQIIRRGVVLADRDFARVHPNEHIQPAAPFYGRS